MFKLCPTHFFRGDGPAALNHVPLSANFEACYTAYFTDIKHEKILNYSCQLGVMRAA